MGYKDYFPSFLIRSNQKKAEPVSLNNVGEGISRPVDPSNYYPDYYPRISRDFYTGEKTPGELGAAIDYILDYTRLRIYSWQSYLQSEITQTVINKFNLWVVGSGLRLQAEPNTTVLEQEGIKIPADFQKNVEERFKIWQRSREVDHSKLLNLGRIAYEAHKHARIGGDVLIVLRVVKGRTTVQMIDGEHVITPFLDNRAIKEAERKGNIIRHGVEISETGEHVAYHVLGSDNKFYRVPRIGVRSGRLMAYLIYGNRYRVDECRGMPLISAVLETLKKLDRYKEATVGSAEERQKIAYAIEHGKNSDGENPLLAKLQQSRKLGTGEAPETKSEIDFEAAASKIATTTGKQAFNLPVDSQLKLLESKNELYFKEFYDTNFNSVCSSMMIPPEVARSMYNSNYSASRAAIKDWEYSLETSRDFFSGQFYDPYYNLWLDVEVLNGKIMGDGYIQATRDKNIMALEAYRNARWMGAKVPHIDPLKEVTAVRKKLGDESTPLITFEQAVEELGLGDWTQIISKNSEERKLSEKLIPKKQEPDPSQQPQPGKQAPEPEPNKKSKEPNKNTKK